MTNFGWTKFWLPSHVAMYVGGRVPSPDPSYLHIQFLHQKRANVNRRMDRSCNLVCLMWFGADLSPALSSIRTIANPRQPDRSKLPHRPNPPGARWPQCGRGAPLGPPASPLAVLAAVARPCYCRSRAAPLQLGKEARVASRLGPASH